MRNAIVARTPSVRYRELGEVLRRHETSWNDAAHVSATASLGRAIREEGHLAVSVAGLLDLVWSSPDRKRDLLEAWPEGQLFHDSRQHYDSMLKQAAGTVRSLRVQDSLLFDDRLRSYTEQLGGDEKPAGRVLVHGRQELSRTISALVQAGFAPRDVAPASAIGDVAIGAWEYLEAKLPEISRPRRVLWSEDQSIDNSSLVQEALAAAFGWGSRQTLVHHGFYFYTPPQWRLFQLIDGMGIRQAFVVHDDGRSRAFETWRRYFSAGWGFDVPDAATEEEARVGPLDLALSGRAVGQGSDHPELHIVKYKSPADLAVNVSRDTTHPDKPPLMFAADRPTVERWMQRLHGPAATAQIDLGSLPIGAFLRGLYGSIREDSTGAVHVDIDVARMVDVLAANFLDSAGVRAAAVLRQASRFFEGARTSEQWVRRAAELTRLVGDFPANLARVPSATDLDRIDAAVKNPLRTVPWLDLAADDAAHLQGAISQVTRLVEALVETDRRPLGHHWQVLDDHLQHGLRAVDSETADEVARRLQAFRLGDQDTEVGIQSVSDVVSIILAGSMEGENQDGEDETTGSVNDLRALDALGLTPSEAKVRVLNLADGAFPRRGPGVGWPFRFEDLDPRGAHRDVVELMRTRSETGALSDLYLLALALDGTTAGASVELSWVERVQGEDLSKSPFLALIAELDESLPAGLRDRAGGVAVDTVSMRTDHLETGFSHLPEPAPTQVSADLSSLNRVAAATGAVCARRFALQWVLSRSHAWRARHHQAMVFGNVRGALVQKGMASVDEAEQLTNEAWTWLSDGERISSRAKAVIPPSGSGARPEWIHFLRGSKSGHKNRDVPYQDAINEVPPSERRLMLDHDGWLPPGVSEEDADQCEYCPVREACSVAKSP